MKIDRNLGVESATEHQRLRARLLSYILENQRRREEARQAAPHAEAQPATTTVPLAAGAHRLAQPQPQAGAG